MTWPIDAPERVPEHVAKIVAFLEGIGIATAEAEIGEDTVLPAMTIRDGVILYDPARLERPGDLLHEAGHLALSDPARRNVIVDFDAEPMAGGNELGSIAWSWAAALAAGIDPNIAFHPDAYRGEGEWLRETFAAGSFVGLPMLQYYGLARRDGEAGAPFPAMIRWLR